MIPLPKKLLLVFGTRPEIIKLAPIYFACTKRQEWNCRLCFTGQHRELGQQMLDDLNLTSDISLDLMQVNQQPSAFLGAAIPALDVIIRAERPDWVVVQGDTTTALAGAFSSFYTKHKLLHLEAGLRTYNKSQPFPEEIHRQLISRLADVHCVPSESALNCLLNESIEEGTIFNSGNTVVDCLLQTVDRNRIDPPRIQLGPNSSLTEKLFCGSSNQPTANRMVLITGHRRESFGEGFRSICSAVLRLASKYQEVEFVYTLHLNPEVRDTVQSRLGGVPNIHLLDPQPYRAFIRLLERCTLVLTDSGGIQEEAPALGKPLVIMRELTERNEVVTSGSALVAGRDESSIIGAVSSLLSDPDVYDRMSIPRFPFGDGHAAEKVLDWLNAFDSGNNPQMRES